MVNQDGFKAPLKQMPYPAMPTIAGLGGDAVELPHAFGQVPVRRLYQKVVVVVHQAPSITEPVELRDDLLQCQQKRLTILIVFKNTSRRSPRAVT